MYLVALVTPLGLAFASGLNAYLPMLAFALAVRWWHMYSVNPHFAFTTQSWFIAALVILTLIDFVADKIPLIEHLWNAIHTIIRPIAGAIVAIVASSSVLPGMHIMAATGSSGSGAAPIAFSAIPVAGAALLVILIVGGVLAALSHTSKLTARFVSTITSAGFLNIVLSLVDDVLVLLIILLSLFAPTIMFILLVLFVLVFVPRYLRSRNTWVRGPWHS